MTYAWRVAPSRLLFTIDRRRCPFGCEYCFASFDDPAILPTLSEIEANPHRASGTDFIYPGCDVEIFARNDWNQVLRRSAALHRSMSLATKAKLTESQIRTLAELAHDYSMCGLFIKLGVSVSTKYALATIEPRTATYEERLDNARRLVGSGVHAALLLRPLLPQVNADEYDEILYDFRPYTDVLLVGELWLSASTSAVDGENCRKHPVGWLSSEITWIKRHAPELVEHVLTSASAYKYDAFTSDLDLMSHVASRYRPIR